MRRVPHRALVLVSVLPALRRFRERARDEVDLSRLLAEVRLATLDALGPAGVGRWVRARAE